MLPQDGIELGQLGGRALRIPHVGVTRDRAERLPAARATDHDGQVPLHRRGLVMQLAEGVMPPGG